MRESNWDQPKSLSQLRKEVGKVCAICGEPLSNLMGPGSTVYCAEHKAKSSEYGGAGKGGRPHTFHREWKCVHCSKDVSVEVLKKYQGIDALDPDLFNRLCRNRIIGDHIIRKSDGGTDDASNIQSLCLDCNADKTILSKDNRIGLVKQNALNTDV